VHIVRTSHRRGETQPIPDEAWQFFILLFILLLLFGKPELYGPDHASVFHDRSVVAAYTSRPCISSGGLWTCSQLDRVHDLEQWLEDAVASELRPFVSLSMAFRRIVQQ